MKSFVCLSLEWLIFRHVDHSVLSMSRHQSSDLVTTLLYVPFRSYTIVFFGYQVTIAPYLLLYIMSNSRENIIRLSNFKFCAQSNKVVTGSVDLLLFRTILKE
jgi:hypothetical protein